MIHQPLQLQKDGQPTGRWHQTCRNIEGGAPVTSECCMRCAHKDDGHPTAEDARLCFLQSEGAVFEIRSWDDQQQKCDECGAWTSDYALAGRVFLSKIPLCRAHQSAPMVVEHYVAID